MTRETAEHVAELAALLAQRPYTFSPVNGEEGFTLPACKPHLAASAAIALCKVARAAHKLAESQCNEDISEATADRTHARLADCSLAPGDGAGISDTNGNRIGSWQVAR